MSDFNFRAFLFNAIIFAISAGGFAAQKNYAPAFLCLVASLGFAIWIDVRRNKTRDAM